MFYVNLTCYPIISYLFQWFVSTLYVFLDRTCSC